MVAGGWLGPAEVFDRLEGCWSLARSIEPMATMNGLATFTRLSADALACREEGTTTLASGQRLKAHRSYRFERATDGFVVLFDEAPPRLFQRVALASQNDALAAAASHLCAPDRYESSYRFLPDGSFVIRHEVLGPRKDYVSVTRFTRLSCRRPSSG